MIDPVLEQIERDLDFLKKMNLNLKFIFETHVHADHITGAWSLKEKTGAKICYGSENGVEGADVIFEDGHIFSLDGHEIHVLHTPGHTKGCTSYYVEGHIFTGDTLFSGSIGRTDLPGGNLDTLLYSIHTKLMGLEESIIIH